MTLSIRHTLILVALAWLLGAALPAMASASSAWQTGPLVESQDFNCVTGDVEQEAGSYLSYYTDPSHPPQAGQVYYVAIDIAGIGNTCAGIYADVNLITPSGTAPAVSAANPVRCYLKFPNSNSFQQDTGSDCPQSLGLGPHGYSLDPRNVNPPFWPLPQGGMIEIQVPVVSSTPPAQDFYGYVQLADGDQDPTLTPDLYAIVDQASTPAQDQIGVFYSTPSISNQSEPGGAGTAVQANYTAWVRNNSNAGSVVGQLALADSAGDCSTPKLIFTTMTPAPLQNPQTELNGYFTGMYPGGAYCWRLEATVTSGPQQGVYDGNWEYFATIGTYLTGQSGPYVPPPAQPNNVSQCSGNASGSGCATSNCNASSCSSGGSVSGLSHMLLLSFAGTGSGSVSGPAKFACTSSCGGRFAPGSKVTLTATPAPGSRFAGWSGGNCSGTATCTITMSSDEAVKATFMLPAPACSLTPRTSKLSVQRSRSGRILGGTLAFRVRCNQAAGGTVAGMLTTVRTGVKKHYRLAGRVSVWPNNTSLFVVRLPFAAVKAIEKGAKASLSLTLTATNVNGSSQVTATLSRVRH